MMYVKIHHSGDRVVIAICDEELIGKKISEGALVLNISERFYKGEKKSQEEVKKILESKIVKDKIYKKFPETFSKKKINKKKLALIVFSDRKKLRSLEKVIHPLVKKKKNLFLNRNKNKEIIIMEIPIIFEKKNKKNYDYIILMDVNKKIQRQRIIKRKNMTPQLFEKILSNQILNKKRKDADFVINNNDSKDKTKQILNKTLEKIISTRL